MKKTKTIEITEVNNFNGGKECQIIYNGKYCPVIEFNNGTKGQNLFEVITKLEIFKDDN